jgi:hypothetical protein
MAAYAKVKLVTSAFHPSDIAFARGWSAAAPGLGGWQIQLDNETSPERVSIIPPGALQPAFVVTRGVRDVILRRHRANGEDEEIGSFVGLREALLSVCPLDDDALVEIHESLEVTFPRYKRGKHGESSR